MNKTLSIAKLLTSRSFYQNKKTERVIIQKLHFDKYTPR